MSLEAKIRARVNQIANDLHFDIKEGSGLAATNPVSVYARAYESNGETAHHSEIAFAAKLELGIELAGVKLLKNRDGFYGHTFAGFEDLAKVLDAMTNDPAKKILPPAADIKKGDSAIAQAMMQI